MHVDVILSGAPSVNVAYEFYDSFTAALALTLKLRNWFLHINLPNLPIGTHSHKAQLRVAYGHIPSCIV